MNMKRKIMKVLMPLALAVVLLFSTIFASGCYVIKGVKMKDLQGTYELTNYSAKTNRIEENEMKLYVVFNSSGNGYYVYQDKDTQLHAAELRCRFINNQEDSSKYDYVEFEFSNTNSWTKFGVFGKNLNYNTIVWKPLQWGKPLEKDYDVDVDFKKISSKTDLSYVEKMVGEKLSVLPYGLPNAGGVYELSGITHNDYYISREDAAAMGVEEPVYAYIRLDVFKNEITYYYMFASDEQQKEIVRAITVEANNGNYTIKDSENNEWSLIGSQLFRTEPLETEGDYVKWIFSCSASVDYDLTETIANRVTAYEEDKCNYGKHMWTTPDVDQCEVQSSCSQCGATQGENVEHTYDDDTDATCNGCGAVREVPETTPEDSEEPIA